jgi:NADP-dependent 3-hydroxy acid dehydrogenase YdfG
VHALDGKVALVTGGGTGIGRAAAAMLAAEGARVVIAGRRREPLDAVVAEIGAAGGVAAARACDLETTAQATALGQWTVQQFGRLDVLVHNAGHSSRARSIRWVTEDEWNSVLAVNLTGVYALTQAVLPGMIERGDGAIITVSSLAALRPGLISGAPYGAAKAAVRTLMGHINAELRNQGIRATTIIPAEVDTPILARRPVPPDAAARATMMQAEDVARVILLCATMPARTLIEEIVMSPTRERDRTAEIAVARMTGAPPT